MNAYEFGKKHGSCEEALKMRKDLGPEATQSDWWLVCDRGDWLIWQLDQVGLSEDNPALDRAIEKTVTRAIRRGQRELRGNVKPWAKAWRKWARGWLSGEDRSRAVAWAAWDIAGLRLQARDIRKEIPTWPGV